MGQRLGTLCCLLVFGQFAGGLARAAGAPVEIPFELEGHNIVIGVDFGSGQRLPFAFDSGLAPGNIVTPEAAKRIGIKPEASLGVHDASGERVDARISKVAKLRIAGLELSDQLFAITSVPRKVLRRPGKGLLAGYIGAPLLADAVVCIDYTRRKLVHWHRPDFPGADLASVPMQLKHGLPTVSVDIDGAPATLIVDSGADTAITVYASFAQQHDFNRRYRISAVDHGNGGSGRQFQALSTQAGSTVLGPGAAFENTPMQVIPQGMDPDWGIDGTLGYQVLRQLNPCLDEAGGRLMYRGE